MTELINAFKGGPTTDLRPLFIHAHPDDETFLTGAFLAWCRALGIPTSVVTCTRGEQGEIVSGQDDGRPITEIREDELAKAIGVLGITNHAYLGTAPARAGAEDRRYPDSGMAWIEPGLAGPAEEASDDCFSVIDTAGPVEDLLALIDHLNPTVLVSYDPNGTYGHPDHIRAYGITKIAAEKTGLDFVMAVPRPTEGFEWFDMPGTMPMVLSASACYPSQATLEGTTLVHVGGQRKEVLTGVGLAQV